MDAFTYLQQQARKHRISRREFLGRTAALGVSAAAATAMYGEALKAAGPNNGGHLVMGLGGGGTTDTLDPGIWANPVPLAFGRCWGEQVVTPSPKDGTPVPSLAESWESTPDAAKWIFKIRKGVTFHNGKDLTADDVAATFERHGDKNAKTSTAALMAGVTSVKATGPQEVAFELAGPNADWPLIISDPRFIIQPNGGKDNPIAGIGTGPYRMETAELGVRYVGMKYSGYWRELGHFDSVEILGTNDATARASALQSGQVHVINRVEPKTAQFLSKAPSVVVESTPGKGCYGFVMHCNTAPFDNADLRMALKLAIDREEMLKQIQLGYGTLGNDFPINAAYDLAPEDIEQRRYDPEKAAFYYKKSGHSGKVMLSTSDAAFSGAVDAAALYQQSAKKAGIDIEVQQEPADGYWSNVWLVKPFCGTYWAGGPNQDQMYSSAYLSDAAWNETKWVRPEFDKLLVQARGELDRTKRKAMYRQLALMVRDDGGSIFPVFNNWIDAHRDNLLGWVQDPSNEMSGRNIPLICWFA